MVTRRGPYLSTNQPSIGTNQVSITTKIVKAHWIAVRSQPNFCWIGSTNSVQPYCRLAIMAMQITPKASCHHFADGESWRSIPEPLWWAARP